MITNHIHRRIERVVLPAYEDWELSYGSHLYFVSIHGIVALKYTTNSPTHAALESS
jgi:hypothetical protein